MTFKRMLRSTAAASGILLAVSAIAPATFSMATEARADTNISVNFGIGSFYDRLSPYGNWVSYNNSYVWLPEHVSAHWRPYTQGHWAYTRRYGWLWVSNERFGWATYHYGRWGYSRDIGWYWVPGRRWAPAWVAWSHSGNDVAWAPLPPNHGNDVNISISIGDIPDYYWQAVPVSAFLSIDLAGHVIRDRNRVRTVIQSGDPQPVRIENNVVINNVIELNFIEKGTNKKVRILQEKTVDTPEGVGKADSNSVAIFNPDVKEAGSAKPARTRKVEEVAKERKTKGIQPEDQPTDQTGAPIVITDPNAQAAPTDSKSPDTKNITTDVPMTKPKTDKAVAPPQTDTGATKTDVPITTDAPVTKPMKDKKVEPRQTDTGAATTDVPLSKKKKSKSVEPIVPQDTQQNVVPQQADQQNGNQQSGKKKKKDTGSGNQPATGQSSKLPADGQPPLGKDKSNKKAAPPSNDGATTQPKCDPAIEVCPPAE